MKRVAFTVVFVFLACFCFARAQQDSFELGVAFPYFVENSDVSGIDVKTAMSTIAVNFSGISFYTEKVGIGAYADIIFPQKMKISALGQSASVDSSAYDFLMALDMLIGPAFLAYKNEKFSLPIAVGFHGMQLWSVVNSLSTNGLEFGLGANITGECNITNNLYLLARLQLTLDFFSINTVEQYVGYNKIKTTDFATMTTWGLNPTLGIGFQF
jgi:hypothetical protein